MAKKIILGLFAGIVSGLFGAGGGMITVPAFSYIFGLDEKVARATSVFVILPMAMVSSIFYYNSNFIDWSLAVKCLIGGVVGGVVGARLLKKMSPAILEALFIALLIYVAIRMIMG